MSEDSGEKTFAPSEKRLRDAAGKGDVLRSRELGTAVGLGVGALALKLAGAWFYQTFTQALDLGLRWDRAALEAFSAERVLMALLALALPPVLLLGGAVMLATVASQLAFGPGRFNMGQLAPKASRINPVSGLVRMFGATGWIEMAKGLAKVALLGVMAWIWARGRLDALAGLGAASLAGQVATAWDALMGLLLTLCAGLVLIALVDLPVQWWRRQRRLRMSQQDMRDEHKEAEGSPENKAAQRQRQRQIAMGGVAPVLREAQFVLTNPTHFAVAMAYDPDRASAPIVLAKGRGDKALAMRELAAELALPVLEYPALARSVYYTTRERQVIREELYGAVAAVLAFVFALRRGESVSMPPVQVPMALRFDADGRPDPGAVA